MSLQDVARCLTAAFIALALASMCLAGTITVDNDGGGDFRDIQDAIDAARDGDTVLVRPGEYLIAEPINFNRDRSRRAGGAADPLSPPVKNIVVRSEAGAGETTIRLGYPEEEARAAVLVFENGEGDASKLQGFTLTGGGGIGATWDSEEPHYGGGILCDQGSAPALESCTITGNGANWGAGICCRDSSPSIRACRISGNSADERCGGVLCLGRSSPTLTDCTISENEGSGVHSQDGPSPTLTRCSILDNRGPGVSCAASSVTLADCTISGNRRSACNCCGEGAGGIRLEASSAILANCLILGNSADDGAGVYGSGEGSATLTNCTIHGNMARSGAGGATCEGGHSATLIHCTISGNAGSGLKVAGGSGVSLAGSIVWDNAGGSVLLQGNEEPGGIAATYSCIEGEVVWPGAGNINADPLFGAWGMKDEVFVDSTSPAPGEGTQESPYRDLASALTYSLALSVSSPCLRSAEGGANMGADTGQCDLPGHPSRVVRVAPGTHRPGYLNLAHRLTVLGSGEETVLEGSVFGLRTGAVLSRLKVTGGTSGGIVASPHESPEIRDCSITGNSGVEGGGLFCWSASPSLADCRITANAAFDHGGGVYCAGSAPSLTRCTITGNSAEDYGGGFLCTGSSPALTDCVISGNSGGSGVVCLADSRPILVGCRISGHVGEEGGGLYCADSSPTLIRCEISENRAGSFGGAVYCWNSSPTLDDSRISDNSAGTSGGGFGLWISSNPRISGCIVEGNSAGWHGGGISCLDGSSPDLVNCLIAGNAGKYGGAALYTNSGSAPRLTNCTVSANLAQEQPYGTAVTLWGGSLVLTNCILWGNAGGSLYGEGAVLGVTFSCIESNEPLPGQGNRNDDPLFVLLGRRDDGGTPDDPLDDTYVGGDYHLRPSSPCIDAGTAAGAPTVDIEGSGRPCGAGYDLGAYELGGCSAPRDRLVRGDADGNGDLNISDPVSLLGYLFLGYAAPRCLDAADVDDNGTLDLSDAVFSLSFQFLGGPPPERPFPDCGIDPSADDLDCADYSGCL